MAPPPPSCAFLSVGCTRKGWAQSGHKLAYLPTLPSQSVELKLKSGNVLFASSLIIIASLMATLESLKHRLREEAGALSLSFIPQPLSYSQYKAGYDILTLGLGNLTYNQFIIPQLSRLLSNIESPSNISILEIGPGPNSVVAQIPYHIRRLITKYAAFEPNDIFATHLESCLRRCTEGRSQLPCLAEKADIRRVPFTTDKIRSGQPDMDMCDKAFDVILFCHSMYGMKRKQAYLEKALGMLAERGIIIVFHRGESLFIENLACHQTACFPTGKVSVENSDHQLDYFSSFIAGLYPQNTDAGDTRQEIMFRWRSICREMGAADRDVQDCLWFRSPTTMVAFTKNAASLSNLVAEVPIMAQKQIKNRDARLQRSAAHVVPRDIKDVQHSVRWAIKNKLQLTVLSGGHSDHCIRSNVVTIDMASFNDVNVTQMDDCPGHEPSYLVVAGCGCKTSDIIQKSMEKGLVVPLGARPSIGSGLWLQGGIGHLTRQHGLTCDAIVGAVLVSVESGKILYAGTVPRQYRPPDAVRVRNEPELLWGLKGAGTNFGIVVYVVFQTFTAGITGLRSWSIPVKNQEEAQHELNQFEESVAKKLPRHCSADIYLHYNGDQLLLSGTFFESQTKAKTPITWPMDKSLQKESSWQYKDAMELFNADLYITDINGGHEKGKTFSFKRCIFLKDIGDRHRAARLARAFESRPSDLCYIHLLHGGGAVSDVPSDHTSFGCRDWSYACVITAVWPREDDSCAASDAKQWVYRVANDLLPLSDGVYGADLGPDPRDILLAQRAFGPNLSRLSQLKKQLDPFDVLAYACPLPRSTIRQKLVILITGESCSGKDYCAQLWASIFVAHRVSVRVASISDMTKAEYARTTGADFYQLVSDRTYKELHRERLTTFFQAQAQKRPQLYEDHFQTVVDGSADADVLLITGMRDKAPVAAFSHLIPCKKLVEVNVKASQGIRQSRKEIGNADNNRTSPQSYEAGDEGFSTPTRSDHHADFVFDNTTAGETKARIFAEKNLVPLICDELRQLRAMIRTVRDFPLPGIEFRHILGILEHPRGLAISTSLLQSYFGDWTRVGTIACCEAGGFIFGSALALAVGVPLVTIRKCGKLPPPTISVAKASSHISSPISVSEERIEMSSNAISPTAFVVVVDDVLATGRTLLAVLKLLKEVGIGAENVNILVLVEFPIHLGRAFLRQSGFGMVRVQSLLVFGGV